MMQIGSRETRVSLVIKFSDLLTGETIVGGRDITVISADGLLSPVVKPDGYFVFTGYVPEHVKVSSKTYQNAEIATRGYTGGVLRFALIPRIKGIQTVVVPENAYVGFDRNGYALAAELSDMSTEILLQKDDFCDITDLYHAIVTPDGVAEAVYFEKNLGGGRYSLLQPPKNVYKARGTRLFALYRTLGGAIPIPPGVTTMYVMSDGKITTESLEE